MFDSFDLKLLNAMQEDADRTAEQLAEFKGQQPGPHVPADLPT